MQEHQSTQFKMKIAFRGHRDHGPRFNTWLETFTIKSTRQAIKGNNLSFYFSTQTNSNQFPIGCIITHVHHLNFGFLNAKINIPKKQPGVKPPPFWQSWGSSSFKDSTPTPLMANFCKVATDFFKHISKPPMVGFSTSTHQHTSFQVIQTSDKNLATYREIHVWANYSDQKTRPWHPKWVG